MRRAAMVIVAAAALAACGPVPRTFQRPLITDETPLGSTRAAVRAWHLGHANWCEGRAWDGTDEYIGCEGEANHPRALFRFEDGVATAAVLEVPVAVTSSDERAFDRAFTMKHKPGWPAIVWNHGVADGSLAAVAWEEAPRHADIPAPHARTFDALLAELERRHGAPGRLDPSRTAALWFTRDEVIGLFITPTGDVVETHERPSPPPGQAAPPAAP